MIGVSPILMARVLRIVSTSTLSQAIAVFTQRPTSGTFHGDGSSHVAFAHVSVRKARPKKRPVTGEVVRAAS